MKNEEDDDGNSIEQMIQQNFQKYILHFSFERCWFSLHKGAHEKE